MSDLFANVRQAVSARDAAESYGMPISRHGKARCIWHEDRHPSLSFDSRTGRCKCFACGAGGSSIDLTARLFDLSPLEAAKKLNEDFGLGLDESPCKPPSGPSRAELRREAEQQERKRWAFLCDVERQANEVLSRYPASDVSWEDPQFRRVLKALARAGLELENTFATPLRYGGSEGSETNER
ncbi:MAG: CHC2 zinc finger domain-containing protein [Clostridia bacterium]|nr:CHC2 zinc finger domain-containing protein [Clostridia bacterium]